MHRFSFFLMCLLIALALSGLAVTRSAMATPAHHPKPLAGMHSGVIQIHDDGDQGRGWRRNRFRQQHAHRGEVVDAPFTHVESGRHTYVDAPFAYVSVGKRGRHVVAPFVDLWIAR